jgi:hypothetical protein
MSFLHQLNIMMEWAAALFHIQEVLGSSLISETSYPDSSFS